MDAATFTGLVTFAFVAAFTPGPNNVMLTSSGATFGFGRTIPHIAGIVSGFCFLVLIGGLGFAGLIAAAPWLHQALRIVGVAYLLYLAWKIGTAGRSDSESPGTPLTLWQAAAFQFVNPKAVSVIAGTIASYTSGPQNIIVEIAIILCVFFVATAAATITWAIFGTFIGTLLTSDAALRAFNVVLAVILVASLIPVFFAA